MVTLQGFLDVICEQITLIVWDQTQQNYALITIIYRQASIPSYRLGGLFWDSAIKKGWISLHSAATFNHYKYLVAEVSKDGPVIFFVLPLCSAVVSRWESVFQSRMTQMRPSLLVLLKLHGGRVHFWGRRRRRRRRGRTRTPLFM